MQETYGEDPWLSGYLGHAYVTGLQGSKYTIKKYTQRKCLDRGVLSLGIFQLFSFVGCLRR